MDIDDESGANMHPADLVLEDNEFSEGAEYDGETDDEGDFSEPHDDAGSDWRDEGVTFGGVRREADLEIEVSRDDDGQWTAEVFVPAMANLKRYATNQRNQDLIELENQVPLLQSIGEAFVNTMKGQWDAYFESRSLASTGRLFPDFKQERLAEALRRDKGVISRCRDAYSVRLPKFGAVPLGTLFDAAARGELELAAELVHNYLKKNQVKLDSCAKGTMRSMRAELIRRIAKELSVTERQGRDYLNRMEQEGLLPWP
ncbi:MAG: hypothetical protein EPN89_19835 [Methylovulum sp.]|nr:MAG: hypothetical protein EPN89_19835 [Methylovulum sp.]